MSQNEFSRNGLSPIREQPPKKVNLGQLSPFQMLRMLSKLPQEGPSFSNIALDSTTTTTKPHEPLRYTPAKRNYESEFYAKFNTIPLLNRNQLDTEDLGPRKFWERKRRHDDMIDNESFTAHSDTNYSRLDYKPKPIDQHLDDDDDDDNKTWRTQDMLSEDGDNGVVLNSQRILELRRTVDEQFIEESLLRSQREMENQLREKSQANEVKSQSQENSQINEVKSQSQENSQKFTQELVENNTTQPLIINNHDIPSPQPSVHSTMDLREMYKEINKLPGGLAIDHNVNDDWGIDFGQDWSDNERHSVNEGNTNIEPEENNEIKTHLANTLPFTSFRPLFTSKLGNNTKSLVSANTLKEISHRFFDQLIKDLKARKSSTYRVTDEDIIQIMKRQQVLDDKTTVEQLAYKHLPREITDLLCTSALQQNQLHPPDRKQKNRL